MNTRKFRNGVRIFAVVLIAALAFSASQTVSAAPEYIPAVQGPLPCSSFDELVKWALDKAVVIIGGAPQGPIEQITAFTISVGQENLREVASTLALQAGTPGELATTAVTRRNARFETRVRGSKVDLTFERSTYNPCPPPPSGGGGSGADALGFIAFALGVPLFVLVLAWLIVRARRNAAKASGEV